jgi:hypothetical protein
MESSREAQDVLRERRAESLKLEENAREAERLELEIRDLRKDLGRFQQRYDAFAALGTKHVEVVQKSPYPPFGVIEWAPLKSKLNGKELSAAVKVNIDSIEQQISSREQQIAALLK